MNENKENQKEDKRVDARDADIEFVETNDDGEINAEDKIKSLKEKIKELEKESKENLDRWNRARADYINFQKEVEERRKSDIKMASRGLIEKILPVLDAYDHAKGNKEAWEKVDSNWRSGIEYILGSLQKTLEGEGLVSFGKEEEVFNPELHDPIEIIETNDKEKDDKIATVISNGYKLGNSIIRHAKVKVYRFNK